MRHASGVVIGAALSIVAAAPVEAAPVALLTMPYTMGSLSQALQFMGDGSVRVCDGSVRICDGSVIPTPVAAVAADGSVRLRTQIALLGDGSVRLGDGSVIPADQDGIALTSLTFSPNPFITGTVSVVDAGSPTPFIITFGGSLSLGATDFSYALSGSATLTDAAGDGVSMGAVNLLGLSTKGLVAGGVDGGGVATIGSTLTGNGTTPLTPTSGTGSCVACAVKFLALGFEGSGGGDTYALSGRFDIEVATPVPAPAPLALLASGLVLLGLARRRG